jgi:phage-related protein
VDVLQDVTINGAPLADFGGATLNDYSIGETPFSPEIFQGLNRTSFELLKNSFGLREIRLTFVFTGADLHAVKLNRSRLNSVLFAPVDLFIPDDGFYYRAVCKETGAEELIGQGETEAKIRAEYKLIGVRHGASVSVSVAAGGAVNCLSTMPYTDAKLTATAAAAGSFTLGGAVFSSVPAGGIVVFDGINKLVTVNGQNWALNTVFTRFPALVPGNNTIAATAGPVTVQYEPCYI